MGIAGAPVPGLPADVAMEFGPGATVRAEPADVVLVLPLEVQGPLAESWRGEVKAALVDGLSDGRFAPRSLDEQAVQGCRAAACLAGLAQQGGASHLVRTRLVVEDRDYAVSIELLDAQGEVLAASEESCSVCATTEVVALVRRQSAALRGRLETRTLTPPVLEIDSDPPGAEVFVDGVRVGLAPLEVTTTGGTHRVEARMPGRPLHGLEVVATDGIHVPVTFALELDAASRLGRGWRLAGITTGAAGLGTVAAGAVLWGLDSRPAPGDRCQGTNIDAQGRCRFLYDTRTAGIVLVSVGAVAVIVGASLWIVGRRSHRRAQARLQPSATGLGLVF